jgi:predicted nucleic acid-binding protein
MPVAVLDTSVLIRYLTNDDVARAQSARSYLQSADRRSLLVPDVGMAEITFVLLRVYRWPVADVADAIRAVVSHPAIVVSDRRLWFHVADDLERGSGPVDAYLLRTAERRGLGAVVTFDEGMKELPTVRCIVP